MDEKYVNLLHSDRVLPTTRHSVLARLEPIAIRLSSDDFPPDLYKVLQSVMGRLIPQSDSSTFIDLAARLADQMEKGIGDGWRYADMPSDKEALLMGLRLLDEDARRSLETAFVDLKPAQQDEILTSVQDGGCDWSGLNSKHWFEDLLVNAVTIFVSHPETLDDIGFSGLACWPAWEKVGLGDSEDWEPRARS